MIPNYRLRLISIFYILKSYINSQSVHSFLFNIYNLIILFI